MNTNLPVTGFSLDQAVRANGYKAMRAGLLGKFRRAGFSDSHGSRAWTTMSPYRLDTDLVMREDLLTETPTRYTVNAKLAWVYSEFLFAWDSAMDQAMGDEISDLLGFRDEVEGVVLASAQAGYDDGSTSGYLFDNLTRFRVLAHERWDILGPEASVTEDQATRLAIPSHAMPHVNSFEARRAAQDLQVKNAALAKAHAARLRVMLAVACVGASVGVSYLLFALLPTDFSALSLMALIMGILATACFIPTTFSRAD